jgi:hypothetical protein
MQRNYDVCEMIRHFISLLYMYSFIFIDMYVLQTFIIWNLFPSAADNGDMKSIQEITAIYLYRNFYILYVRCRVLRDEHRFRDIYH